MSAKMMTDFIIYITNKTLKTIGIIKRFQLHNFVLNLPMRIIIIEEINPRSYIFCENRYFLIKLN